MNSRYVILIAPPMITANLTPRESTGNTVIPMGLLSIGSVLREKDYNVKILNGLLGKTDLAAELNQINPKETLFVGISATTAQLPSAIKAASIIRENCPDIPLVWGGVHPTLFPEETCADPLVDVVVIGEGEYTCLELAEAFSGSGNLSHIKGIVYKDQDGNIIFTGKRAPHDLNNLPYPRYELLNLDDYLYRIIPNRENPRERKMGKGLELHTGMGCPYRCTFCINTTVYRDGKYYQKSLYRGKSAPRILDEIQMLIDRYEVEYIQFIDENFLVSKKRLFEFLDGIEKRGLKFNWFPSVRADYFNDHYLSEDVIRRMATLGCVVTGAGAESGSQKMLDYLKKDITLEQVEQVAKITNDNKIISLFSFMMGVPGESVEDMLMTIDFIKKLKKIGKYVVIQQPQLYRPFPGCELYDESIKSGFDAPRSIREWTPQILQSGGTEYGYVNPQSLPWVKKDHKKATVLRYVTSNMLLPDYIRNWGAGEYSEEISIKRLMFAILTGIFQIRRRLGFWAFPVECKVFEIAKEIKNAYKGRKI